MPAQPLLRLGAECTLPPCRHSSPNRPDFLSVLTVIAGVWLRAVVMVNLIDGAWLAVRAVTEMKYTVLSKKE